MRVVKPSRKAMGGSTDTCVVMVTEQEENCPFSYLRWLSGHSDEPRYCDDDDGEQSRA
jgi:hypothetical protein